MDAISFVLGVKSSQLRSHSLKELIYRPGRMLNEDSNEVEMPASTQEVLNAPTRAHVIAVILDRDGQEMHFKRTYDGI